MRLNLPVLSHSARALFNATNNRNVIRVASKYSHAKHVRSLNHSPLSTAISVRQNSTEESGDKRPFYKKLFGNKSQDQIDHEKEIQEKIETEDSILREMEIEEREERLNRKRNRSKLHYSHRNILKGEPPQVGLHMEWDDTHKTRAYKAKLFGQFGRSKTGIDPSICWPTPEEIADEYEKERVFYDNTSLKELIDNDRRMQKEEKEAIILRYIR